MNDNSCHFTSGRDFINHIVHLREMRRFIPDKVPKPFEINQFSLPEGPLDLEIGAGVGLHPILYAKENPNRHIIAIEQTHKRFEKFSQRVSNHQCLHNLTAIHANAIGFVSHFIPERTIENVFLLYPNPYPKKNDLNKRWHAMPFFGFLLSRMKSKSKLILRTNESFYSEEAQEYCTKLWKLNLIEFKILRSPTEARAWTHFEAKYLKRNQNCYHLEFQIP